MDDAEDDDEIQIVREKIMTDIEMDTALYGEGMERLGAALIKGNVMKNSTKAGFEAIALKRGCLVWKRHKDK